MSDQPILTFNAGYADFNEETKVVTPRAGAGKISVIKDPEEAYLYFSWEPRDGFQPPEDFPRFESYVLIPGDAQWIHIKQCTTGRIFSLKFQSSEKREFFWMQSRTDAQDKQPGSLSSQDKEIEVTFNSFLFEPTMNEEEDEEEYEPVSPSVESPVPAPTTVPTSHVSQPNDLTALLRSVTTPNPTSSSSVPVINITDALPTSLLLSHINSLDDEQLEPLLANLPDEIPKTRTELARVIQSSQFAQGIDSFSNVLMQGGLGPIVARELEYPYQGEGVEGFLSGARKAAANKEETKTKEDSKSDEMEIE